MFLPLAHLILSLYRKETFFFFFGDRNSTLIIHELKQTTSYLKSRESIY